MVVPVSWDNSLAWSMIPCVRFHSILQTKNLKEAFLGATL